MLGRLIAEHIDLRFLPADDLGNVHADPSQIEQVVMNLVINARDAMPEGGTLTIETGTAVLDHAYAETHVDVELGTYVLVAVTDTGCGMDEATLDRVFEPFFTSKEEGRGTGPGLAAAYGIVKQHRGHIWAYSEPGIGSTFKVYLPLARDRDEAEPEPPPEQFEQVKSHTTIGGDILGGSDMPLLAVARDIALGHHERWDGTGYPKGLARPYPSARASSPWPTSTMPWSTIASTGRPSPRTRPSPS